MLKLGLELLGQSEGQARILLMSKCILALSSQDGSDVSLKLLGDSVTEQMAKAIKEVFYTVVNY